ncbi:hypothetical protein JTB14_031062 [Gonioctena quinquepunctata]|nr:hypothetical protein JTB14_031062 [Gonioctena quinquepunctata]
MANYTSAANLSLPREISVSLQERYYLRISPGCPGPIEKLLQGKKPKMMGEVYEHTSIPSIDHITTEIEADNLALDILPNRSQCTYLQGDVNSKILQINTDRRKDDHHLLLKKHEENNIDLILVQETNIPRVQKNCNWLKDNDKKSVVLNLTSDIEVS